MRWFQPTKSAAAAREGSWTQAVIDSKANIRSHFAPIGPVLVFGPNNFPFAFNGISGGDFAAAIATGCPVIAKANPLHPGTSKLLALCAVSALVESGLPAATVQMLYRTGKEDGLRLVSDPRIGGGMTACFPVREAASALEAESRAGTASSFATISAVRALLSSSEESAGAGWRGRTCC